MVSVVEVREMCMDELRKCEQASSPAERRHHAMRAMSFARLARRIDARTPEERREPPPPDFVAALSNILARLSENLNLTLANIKPPADRQR